jgi:PKD repeat protein
MRPDDQKRTSTMTRRGTRKPTSRRRCWRIEQLEARELLSLAGTSPLHFEFGVSATPVVAGDLAVPASVYDAGKGYGWATSSVAASSNWTADPLRRAYNYTVDNTFLVDVLDGSYDVKVTLGNAATSLDGQAIWAQGQPLAAGLRTSLAAPSAPFIEPTFRVQVTGGQLQLRVAESIGTSRYAVINALDVTPVPASYALMCVSADWGDGSPSGGFNMALATPVTTHTYGDNQAHPLTIQLTGPTTPAALTSPPTSSIAWSQFNATAGQAVSLLGSAVAAAGSTSPLVYSWQFGDGTAAVGLGLTCPSHTYASPGVYAVYMSATDAYGNTGTAASTTVDVIPAASPFQITVSGPTTGSEGTPLTFTAATSGGTGTLSYVMWSLDSWKTIAARTSTFIFTPPDNGVYTVSVGAADTANNRAFAVAKATVSNVAPTAAVGGPYSISIGVPLTFQGSATDPGPADVAAGLTYAWDFGDGGTAKGLKLSAPSHTYTAGGSYTVALTVTDKDGGASKVVTAPVNVIAPWTITVGGPYTSTVGAPVTMTAATSGGTGKLSYVMWSLDGWKTTAARSLSFDYTPTDNGVYTVSVSAADTANNRAFATTTLTVANVLPTATAGGPYTISVGLPLTFQGSATSINPAALAAGFTYNWAFGDGGTATGLQLSAPSHIYAAPGVYTASLTATDKSGAVSKAVTALVTVFDPTQPYVTPGGPYSGNEGSPVHLTSQGYGGTGPYTYAWDVDGSGKFATIGQNVDATFTDNGVYPVKVRVTDTTGATFVSPSAVTVVNVAPTVTLAGNFGGTVNLPLSFQASVTDPGSADVAAGFTFAWDFGDGGTAKGLNLAAPSHAYTATGVYTVRLTVTDKDGGTGAMTTTATVIPPASWTPPVIPQHYSYIRVMLDAYFGNPMGAFEDNLLKNSVDVVMPYTGYTAHITAVAPNTPQMTYSNISSLYTNLLTDWLSYADEHGLSRESAFYHAATPSAFTGNSPSSQAVNLFWGVYSMAASGATVNYTSSAGSGLSSVPFSATAGDALAIGYLEKFREINVSLITPAAGGWSGVLQYPTAVDANGNPTAWATLKTIDDGTAGLRASGRITFDPAADWVTASVGGSVPMYYVRMSTTSGAGTAPVAKSILGRDFVGANGTITGTVPVFDSAADLDHNGYLSDAEFAKANPADTARFTYESRLFATSYGQMRFAANVSAPALQRWAIDFSLRLLSSMPQTVGIGMDNSGGKPNVVAGQSIESIANYAADYGATIKAIATAIAPRWIMLNTGGSGYAADPVIQQNPIYSEEFAIRAMSASYKAFETLADLIAHRSTLTTPTPYAVIDSRFDGGSPTDPRTQIATLAYYYLLADPHTTFLDLFGGNEPGTTWTRHWTDAISFNVGMPTASWSLYATGADPGNAGYTYNVYQRTYQNALVLYKPLSFKDWSSPAATIDDTTATAFNLGGTYQLLHSDGTLGAPVTSVTLRNGEGAILVKVASTGSTTVGMASLSLASVPAAPTTALAPSFAAAPATALPPVTTSLATAASKPDPTPTSAAEINIAERQAEPSSVSAVPPWDFLNGSGQARIVSAVDTKAVSDPGASLSLIVTSASWHV